MRPSFLGIALLLVLAGCTFAPGPRSVPTDETTAAPVPTDSPTPTPRPTPGPGQIRLRNDYDHGDVRVRVLLVNTTGSVREMYANGSRGDRVAIPGPGRALRGGFRGSVASLAVSGAVADVSVRVPANERRTVTVPASTPATAVVTVVDLPYLEGNDPEKIVVTRCGREEAPVAATALVSKPDIRVRCGPVAGRTDASSKRDQPTTDARSPTWTTSRPV